MFSFPLPASPKLDSIPKVLARPLRLLPCALHSNALAHVLNRIFAEERRAGELDFLQQHSFHLHISDLGLKYYLKLQQGRLTNACSQPRADLTITGNLADLLLLASRQEDADTLFFQRRLRLSGTTELGLALKNFLDAVDLSGRLGPLEWILQKLSTPQQR